MFLPDSLTCRSVACSQSVRNSIRSYILPSHTHAYRPLPPLSNTPIFGFPLSPSMQTSMHAFLSSTTWAGCFPLVPRTHAMLIPLHAASMASVARGAWGSARAFCLCVRTSGASSRAVSCREVGVGGCVQKLVNCGRVGGGGCVQNVVNCGRVGVGRMRQNICSIQSSGHVSCVLNRG